MQFWSSGRTFLQIQGFSKQESPNCLVSYDEQKMVSWCRSMSPLAPVIRASCSSTLVHNGAPKTVRKSHMIPSLPPFERLGIPEELELVSVWLWCHCDMYQNGFLRFGPPSCSTGYGNHTIDQNFVQMCKMHSKPYDFGVAKTYDVKGRQNLWRLLYIRTVTVGIRYQKCLCAID